MKRTTRLETVNVVDTDLDYVLLVVDRCGPILAELRAKDGLTDKQIFAGMLAAMWRSASVKGNDAVVEALERPFAQLALLATGMSAEQAREELDVTLAVIRKARLGE